jgi:FkbM family methyltransferase
MNYPISTIDIILLSCNRIDNTKKTIDRLYHSIKYPDKIRLIVVDNESIDGTFEYLKEEKNNGRVCALETCPSDKPITMAYNIGFKHVQSELMIMMQDDIDIPELEPKDIIEQLIDLMNKYQEAGSIGCRIQRIPNLDWNKGNEDLLPARKAASAYFRISRRDDYIKMGMLNDRKDWDDINFCSRTRSLDKECYWTKNLWCSHERGYCEDRGYKIKPRRWGIGIHSRTRQAHIDKPYPIIDPKTCVPLHILNADRKSNRPLNPEQNFWGYKMLTRARYHDENVLKIELDPANNMYRIPDNSKVVIDVGAHIGGTSIRAAKLGATVYAFEPEAYNYEILCHNVRRNRVQNLVHCINLGVGVPGRSELLIHHKNSGAHSSNGYNNIQSGIKPQIIVLISIQDVFKNYNIDHCDVLKLDCEGGEIAIINRIDDELAAKIDQISVEFHDRGLVSELVQKLSQWYVPENTHRYEWVFRKKI